MNEQIPDNSAPLSQQGLDISLVEALTHSKNLTNPRFSFCGYEHILISHFRSSDDCGMRVCEHSHSAYEFIIPHKPIPYLTSEDAVYFGDVGYIYPVKSGRKHGIKYPINDVSYTSIAIAKDFFESVLVTKGNCDGIFNCIIPCSDSLITLIDMFRREYAKKANADITNKLEPLTRLICAELIDLALMNTSDDRKGKTRYQKGVRLAADYINENFASNITLEELAELCGLSVNYFSICFKNTFGEPPKVYITKMRLSKAKTLLEFSSLSAKEIAILCGFKKFNSFSCSFKKYVGVTPGEYRLSAVK